jgi:IS5 family transposase
MSQEKKPLGVSDYAILKRRRKETFLDRIDRMIDWLPIERFLKKKLKREENAVGHPAYPALVMFKVLLVQRWYNLSDEATEDALVDRFSVNRFVGLSMDEKDVPDATTIGRFRNRLIERKIYEKLFVRLNRQLEGLGILVREGSIVDASVVSSARRPGNGGEQAPLDRAEDQSEAQAACPGDEDARWLKKGKKSYYGYKMHLATDQEDGFILGGHVTPANCADTTELIQVLDESQIEPGMRVYADKGYASLLNRHVLKVRGFKDRIMVKAAKNRKLTETEKDQNHRISTIRSRVERVFGTLKRTYGFHRARYVGILKVELEFFLNAMAYNLKKAAVLSLA